MNTTTTATLNLTEWTASNGQRRRYINNWTDILGITFTWRKRTLMGGTYGTESLSRPRAYALNDIKVWLDDADQLHVDGIDEADPVVDAIRSAIEAVLAPEAAETEQAEDPELAAVRARKLRTLGTVDALISDMDARRTRLAYAVPYVAWLRGEHRVADEATAWDEYLGLYRHWMTADLHGADARAAVAHLKR